MNQSMDALSEYFAALERLKTGKSRIVPKGTRITNDAVSVEAGRGKGSIKKSREIFADLIAAIDEAAKEQSKPRNEQRDKIAKSRADANYYRRQWEAAIGREISLLKELYETKKRLADLTGGKVLPLRGKTANKEKGSDA